MKREIPDASAEFSRQRSERQTARGWPVLCNTCIPWQPRPWLPQPGQAPGPLPRDYLRAPARDCYFWATHAGAELDLLVVSGNRRLGFEFKRTAAPRRTRSMSIALADLDLERLDVVYPGTETFPLGDRIRAVGLERIGDELEPVR
jgi:hypothetical protein